MRHWITKDKDGTFVYTGEVAPVIVDDEVFVASEDDYLWLPVWDASILLGDIINEMADELKDREIVEFNMAVTIEKCE